MLVLCSNGLSSENLLKAMNKRIKACNTATVVVTADNEYKEKNYHVNSVGNKSSDFSPADFNFNFSPVR